MHVITFMRKKNQQEKNYDLAFTVREAVSHNMVIFHRFHLSPIRMPQKYTHVNILQ